MIIDKGLDGAGLSAAIVTIIGRSTGAGETNLGYQAIAARMAIMVMGQYRRKLDNFCFQLGGGIGDGACLARIRFCCQSR